MYIHPQEAILPYDDNLKIYAPIKLISSHSEMGKICNYEWSIDPSHQIEPLLQNSLNFWRQFLDNTQLSAQVRASTGTAQLQGPSVIMCDMSGTQKSARWSGLPPLGCLLQSEEHSRPTLAASGYLPDLSLCHFFPLSHTSLLFFPQIYHAHAGPQLGTRCSHL